MPSRKAPLTDKTNKTATDPPKYSDFLKLTDNAFYSTDNAFYSLDDSVSSRRTTLRISCSLA